MDIYTKFGCAVISRRTKIKMSQERLAVEAGISPRYMSDIENGKRQLSLEYAERIAVALGIKLSELINSVETIEQ